jgi:hypothetical protein
MKKLLLSAVTALSLLGTLTTARAQDSTARAQDCNEDRGWHIVGGVDALFLRPHINNNSGLTISTSQSVVVPPTPPATATSQTTRSNSSSQAFDYNWSVSPRVWIGIENCDGVGIRGRWFHYDQAADTVAGASSSSRTLDPITLTQTLQSTTATAGGVSGGLSTQGLAPGSFSSTAPADRVAGTSSLFIDMWDVEATLGFKLCGCDLKAAGGVRYAFIEQTLNGFHPGLPFGSSTGALAEQATSSLLISRQTFTGVGPTVALEALRRLGDSNFSLYGNARGAALFGRGRVNSEFTSSSIFGFTTPALMPLQTFQNVSTNRSSTWDVLPIAEFEIGFQWGRQMGGLDVFFRPAFVGQVYFDGGNASNRSSDFGLVGGALTAGVRF